MTSEPVSSRALFSADRLTVLCTWKKKDFTVLLCGLHKIMRSFVSHVRATRWRRTLQRFWKKLRFDYVTLLECGNCFVRSHSFLVRHTQCIMGQWRPYVRLAWRIQYCVLPPCACVQVPSTIFQVVILDKDPFRITSAAVSSNDFKGATMLLVVYFISFCLFCHQTGQYIARITERTRYCQPIF